MALKRYYNDDREDDNNNNNNHNTNNNNNDDDENSSRKSTLSKIDETSFAAAQRQQPEQPRRRRTSCSDSVRSSKHHRRTIETEREHSQSSLPVLEQQVIQQQQQHSPVPEQQVQQSSVQQVQIAAQQPNDTMMIRQQQQIQATTQSPHDIMMMVEPQYQVQAQILQPQQYDMAETLQQQQQYQPQVTQSQQQSYRAVVQLDTSIPMINVDETLAAVDSIVPNIVTTNTSTISNPMIRQPVPQPPLLSPISICNNDFLNASLQNEDGHYENYENWNDFNYHQDTMYLNDSNNNNSSSSNNTPITTSPAAANNNGGSHVVKTSQRHVPIARKDINLIEREKHADKDDDDEDNDDDDDGLDEDNVRREETNEKPKNKRKQRTKKSKRVKKADNYDDDGTDSERDDDVVIKKKPVVAATTATKRKPRSKKVVVEEKQVEKKKKKDDEKVEEQVTEDEEDVSSATSVSSSSSSSCSASSSESENDNDDNGANNNNNDDDDDIDKILSVSSSPRYPKRVKAPVTIRSAVFTEVVKPKSGTLPAKVPAPKKPLPLVPTPVRKQLKCPSDKIISLPTIRFNDGYMTDRSIDFTDCEMSIALEETTMASLTDLFRIIQESTGTDTKSSSTSSSSLSKDHELSENLKLTSFKLAPSKSGKLLKQLTNNYLDSCRYTLPVVNYTKLNLITDYYLVYGAVPKLMKDAALYFMKCFVLSYMKHARDLIDAKKCDAVKNLVCAMQGEVEIMTYIYWMLESTDLIEWKDDVPRKTLKSLLMYACSLLPDGTFKQGILDRAYFGKNDYVTAQCLIFIKHRYHKIPSECINVWNHVMRAFKIHHFASPFTMREMYNMYGKVCEELAMLYFDHEAGKYKCYDKLLSKREVHKLYKTYVKSESQVTNDLQLVTNNLITWIIQDFAKHLIDIGYFPTCNVLYTNLIDGYLLTKKDLSCGYRCVSFADSPPSLLRKIYNFLNMTLNLNLRNQNVSRGNMATTMTKLKASDESRCALLEAIVRIISKAITPPIATYQAHGSNRWVEMFTDAIESFLHDHSVGMRDAWVRFDSLSDTEMNVDDDSDDGDYKGCCSDLSDDYDSDASFDNDGGNRKVDKTEYYGNMSSYVGISNSIEDEDGSATMRIITKKRSKRPKVDSVDFRYKYAEKPISRTYCVMCAKVTTTKLLMVSDTVHIPACMWCYCDFNTKNYDVNVLCKRVADKLKMPIFFHVDEKDERSLIPDDNKFGLTVLTYNYILRQKKSRKIGSGGDNEPKPKKAKRQQKTE